MGSLPYCSADGPKAAYGEREGEGAEPDAALGDASSEHACHFCVMYGMLRSEGDNDTVQSLFDGTGDVMSIARARKMLNDCSGIRRCGPTMRDR